MKKCPKCDKIYMDYDQYCLVCRYKLKYIEGTEVIDYPPEPHEPIPVRTPNAPRVECPYCHSTFTKKISKTSKMLGNSFFGIFAAKRYKEWHCNNCNSDF